MGEVVSGEHDDALRDRIALLEAALRDVDADAMAFGRAAQVDKPGRAADYRAARRAARTKETA